LNFKKIIIFLVIIVALTFAGVMLWFSLHNELIYDSTNTEKKPTPYPLQIKGFVYSSFNDRGPVYRIKADELKINPRKFFVFNIRSLNEVTLENAEIAVYLYPEAEEKVGLFPLKEQFAKTARSRGVPKGFGVLTRGVIKNLVLKIYKAEKEQLIVRAQKARIDFKKNVTKLSDASIQDITADKIITSQNMYWSEEEKAFRIPGEYVVDTPLGRTGGKGVKIDLEFTTKPLS
jgi:hypothetical protein